MPVAAAPSLIATNTDLLYRQSVSAFMAAGANALLFVLVMWTVVEHATLLAWFAATVTLMGLRSALVWRYLRIRPGVSEASLWARRFVAFTALSGALWGTTAIYFFPLNEPLYQMFVIFLLAGTSAGATSTLSSVPRAYPVFVLPMILPLAIRLFTMGGVVYPIMGLVTVFHTSMMLRTSRQIRATIVDHHRTMLREQSRSHVMELLTEAAPMAEVLSAVVHGIEEQDPNILCSILLADRSGQRLLLGAAPSLPDFYNDAIHGIVIGEGVGCCGTAVSRRQRVIVEDVVTHPFWVGFRHLAARAGLRSCWSEPIIGAGGVILGTFAIYHRFPCTPSAEQVRMIEGAAKFAGLAIERKQIEDELQLAALVYRHCSEAMVVMDADERIIAINPACTALTGYVVEDVVGRRARVFRLDNDVRYRDLLRSLRRRGSWQGELWIRRKSGESCAVWFAIRSILNNDGGVHRRVALMSDITEKKRADEMIWKQANYDFLTGLPNRRLFRDRLEQEIKKAHRAGRRMALLFLDLDRFKEVNDTLGHDIGDMLLAEVAQRIARCVREADTVARLGGDEFTVVLSEIDDAASAERIAQAVIEQLGRPFILNQQPVCVTASVGIMLYPDDGLEVEDLLRKADQAMYAAKSAGRNRFSYLTGGARPTSASA